MLSAERRVEFTLSVLAAPIEREACLAIRLQPCDRLELRPCTFCSAVGLSNLLSDQFELLGQDPPPSSELRANGQDVLVEALDDPLPARQVLERFRNATSVRGRAAGVQGLLPSATSNRRNVVERDDQGDVVGACAISGTLREQLAVLSRFERHVVLHTNRVARLMEV